MVALLERLGLIADTTSKADGLSNAPQNGSYGNDLTADQIAYLKELADERRREWMARNRQV